MREKIPPWQNARVCLFYPTAIPHESAWVMKNKIKQESKSKKQNKRGMGLCQSSWHWSTLSSCLIWNFLNPQNTQTELKPPRKMSLKNTSTVFTGSSPAATWSFKQIAVTGAQQLWSYTIVGINEILKRRLSLLLRDYLQTTRIKRTACSISMPGTPWDRFTSEMSV